LDPCVSSHAGHRKRASQSHRQRCVGILHFYSTLKLKIHSRISLDSKRNLLGTEVIDLEDIFKREYKCVK
jgi:hypothetical protein